MWKRSRRKCESVRYSRALAILPALRSSFGLEGSRACVMKKSIPVELELECEDEGWLNSPTCVECGWHPEDEGHDDDCPLSAALDEGK